MLLDAYPALKKYYYGEQAEGVSQNFNVIKEKYRESILEEVKHLQFIGLPTGSYERQQLMVKPELAKIYIPLYFTIKKDDSQKITIENILRKTNRVVILGDPGTGKSTLAKYLALIHSQEPGENKKSKIVGKIPFIISIREFVRLQQEKKSQTINFIDYLKYIAESNYAFNNIDKDFFIAMFEMGKALALFDGLDEVASESGRTRMAKNIRQFAQRFPDSPIWVTSRIVGYTVDVKLEKEVFNHYYLAPVSQNQAKEFIKKWYEIQLPKNKNRREDRIRVLQSAVEDNAGVQRLKTNPLLLTMMTLVHQFEGTLPYDRVKLYEKCIELLLKTWQEHRYSDQGIKNPLEERGLKYNDQLKLLAATAFHIQKKNWYRKSEDVRGLIEEKELLKVLLDTWFDKKRISEEIAAEDIRIFLDYIRERVGLFVEKGRNKKGQNVFAFVHLSFLEYLCAYQAAEDKSKDQKAHIKFLLGKLGKAAWEEIILLSLYLFEKSTGPSFTDAFCKVVFEKLSRDNDPNGWFLMGRAVRDNIRFARKDIKRITGEIVKIWLKENDKDIVVSILKEITRLSKEGKKVLKGVINEIIMNKPPERAFDSLYLYKQLYEIDDSILEVISKNKHINFLAYLPVYRDNEILAGYIDKKMEERQWIIYYNSAADKTNDKIEKLLKGKLNSFELKGFTISAWSKIFIAFKNRTRFLEINKSQLDTGIKNEYL